MKLAWGILTNHQALWVQVLHSKYKVKDSDFSCYLQNAHCSNLWSVGKLKQDFVWALGNGKLTNFWMDSWLMEDICLAQLATINVPRSMRRETVSDYVDSSGCWNWARKEAFLPAIVLFLSNYPPPTPSSDRDSMIWKFISSRQFTVKTGQLWFSRSITVDKDRAWNTIWQWQGPQRVRTFLWLGYHERILTNVERARRHLSASNNCRVCNGGTETILHALRNFPGAHYVWSKLIPRARQSGSFSGTVSLKDWLK